MVAAPTFSTYLALSARSGGARRTWLASPAYWACQLIGWGLNAANDLNNAFRDSPGSGAGATAARIGGFFVAGIVISHLLRVVILHERRRGPHSFRGWIPLAAYGVVAALVLTLALAGLAAWLTPHALAAVLRDMPATIGPPLLVFTVLHAAFLAVWVGLYFVAQFIRFHRQVELDRWSLALAAQRAELEALHAQLNPHFLFNALNSIRGLIPHDATPARTALSQLSALLRASLGLGRREIVPFVEELAMVRHYLALETLRYGARLQARFDVNPAAEACAVPPFLLQTLVENAVKHGVQAREAGSRIIVAADLPAPGTLRLRVTNQGRLAAPGDSPGTGLARSRHRLALLFGPTATVALRADADDTVTAEATFPARPAPLA